MPAGYRRITGVRVPENNWGQNNWGQRREITGVRVKLFVLISSYSQSDLRVKDGSLTKNCPCRHTIAPHSAR